MPRTILETARLVVREWDPDGDAAAAAEINGDPEVVRFIGGRRLVGVEANREFLLERSQRGQPLEHLGYWAVVERETGLVVGSAILDPIPIDAERLAEDVQVGWVLRRDRWGRGYASEYGAALIRHGLEVAGMPRVLALIEPPNAASHAVARRLGLTYGGRTSDYYGGLELDLYACSSV